jgi:hypothetical protein
MSCCVSGLNTTGSQTRNDPQSLYPKVDVDAIDLDLDSNYGLLGDDALYNHGAGRDPKSKKKPETKKEAQAYMDVFKSTFCRKGVRVYFLGLFDCVNSVARFDVRENSSPYIPRAPATHIRHALSIHERRTKFKPSLFLIEPEPALKGVKSLKEVWFAGNHGDIGGGWPVETDASGNKAKFLISDIALEWMVGEVRQVDCTKKVSSPRMSPICHVDLAKPCLYRTKLFGEKIKLPG